VVLHGDGGHPIIGFQVPGRVGDAAVPGGGAYADSAVGGCGSTGDGDIHLRFLPCYQVRQRLCLMSAQHCNAVYAHQLKL
jgi:isoaspartyl peptidase/L-asparaginase-like protein (Ntn-hydrolase superfamily)